MNDPSTPVTGNPCVVRPAGSPSERTYDFLKDAEELRRLRANPPAKERLSAGFTRGERYAFVTFFFVVLAANLAAVVSFLAR